MTTLSASHFFHSKSLYADLFLLIIILLSLAGFFAYKEFTISSSGPSVPISAPNQSQPKTLPPATSSLQPVKPTHPSPVNPTPKTPAVLPKDFYTVQPGDTLSSIAGMYGLSLSWLEQLNPQITDPGLIYAGQSIKVSGTPPPAPANPTPAPSATVPVIHSIQTTQPVVFLTIDDGIYQEPKAASLMQADKIHASFFLVYSLIKNNPSYFANLSSSTGSLIEDHTYDHATLTNLTYDQQVQEIIKDSDLLTQLFGRRPVLFRPPGGHYNSDTVRAAAACGMKAVVLWDVTVNNGSLQYVSGNHLRPGDIVLMHFRATFVQDINAFNTAMKAQGLHTELLENWIN